MHETVRLVVAIAVGLLLVTLTIGGLATPIDGTWRDGDRLITLRQRLFRVRGECERRGGFEIYRGWALFGRVWLARADHGAAHLQEMGFASAMAKAVDGQVTAHLAFRLADGRLHGTFTGLGFRFVGNPPRLAAADPQAQSERSWQAVDA